LRCIYLENVLCAFEERTLCNIVEAKKYLALKDLMKILRRNTPILIKFDIFNIGIMNDIDVLVNIDTLQSALRSAIRIGYKLVQYSILRRLIVRLQCRSQEVTLKKSGRLEIEFYTNFDWASIDTLSVDTLFRLNDFIEVEYRDFTIKVLGPVAHMLVTLVHCLFKDFDIVLRDVLVVYSLLRLVSLHNVRYVYDKLVLALKLLKKDQYGKVWIDIAQELLVLILKIVAAISCRDYLTASKLYAEMRKVLRRRLTFRALVKLTILARQQYRPIIRVLSLPVAAFFAKLCSIIIRTVACNDIKLISIIIERTVHNLVSRIKRIKNVHVCI